MIRARKRVRPGSYDPTAFARTAAAAWARHAAVLKRLSKTHKYPSEEYSALIAGSQNCEASAEYFEQQFGCTCGKPHAVHS